MLGDTQLIQKRICILVELLLLSDVADNEIVDVESDIAQYIGAEIVLKNIDIYYYTEIIIVVAGDVFSDTVCDTMP